MTSSLRSGAYAPPTDNVAFKTLLMSEADKIERLRRENRAAEALLASRVAPPSDQDMTMFYARSMEAIRAQAATARALQEQEQSSQGALIEEGRIEILQQSGALEELLDESGIRRSAALELVLSSLETLWARRVTAHLAVASAALPASGAGWTVGLLREAMSLKAAVSDRDYPIEIVVGRTALEERVRELRSEQWLETQQFGFLFCTASPESEESLQHVGHVVPLFFEVSQTEERCLLLDGCEELFATELQATAPAAFGDKIILPLEFLRRLFRSEWPSCRLFGFDFGLPRQTDRRSCGFFALHDLRSLFREQQRGHSPWDAAREWGTQPEARSGTMPFWLAKIGQRRWSTLESHVESGAVSKDFKARYAIAHESSPDESVNGATLMKTLRLMMRLLGSSKESPST